MSVQSVWRAKAYAERLKKEFVNPRSSIRTMGKGVKTAQEIDSYFRCVYNLRSVMFAMAKTASTSRNGKTDFKGFVNYVLTAEDKELYQKWEADDHDLWLLLATDIQGGYKLTVGYNSQNDTFNATYMCNDPDDKNAGYCLSAFAPDWYNAVKSLVFKHNEILQCVWPIDGKTVGNNWG